MRDKHSSLKLCFNFVWLLCFPYIIGADHFLGGVVTWKPVEGSATNEISVSWIWTQYRGGSGYCTQMTIDDQTLIGDSTNMCQSMPDGPCFDIQGYCVAFSPLVPLVDRWTSIVNTATFTGTALSYTLRRIGGDWEDLANGGVGVKWDIRTLVDLNPRADGGGINTSPITTLSPRIKVFPDTENTIVIPVADVDGDTIRCRWASGESAGIIEPDAERLSIDQDMCIITFNAPSDGAYWGVALYIEDFIYPFSTTPLSRIPVQFLIQVVAPPAGCDTTKPTLIAPSPMSGLNIGITIGVQYTAEIRASPKDAATPISDIATLSPPEMVKSALMPGPSDEMYVDIDWTPMADQTGPNIFCFYATDMCQSTDTSCVTLSAQDCDPACQNGGACDGSTCDCTVVSGWAGPTCEIAVTCSPECENGGSCIDTDTCGCPSGYSGSYCEIGPQCNPPCLNGGTCFDTDMCFCPAGFEGAGCSQSVFAIWINPTYLGYEGTTISIYIHRSLLGYDTTLDLTVVAGTGTATEGTDFETIDTLAISFSGENLIEKVDIDLEADADTAEIEYFQVQIGNIVVDDDTGTIVIDDDEDTATIFIIQPSTTDPPPPETLVNIGLDQSSYCLSEGGTVDVIVNRAGDGKPAAVTYDISVRLLGATQDTDFTGVPTTSESVSQGSTDTITITGVTDSDDDEDTEVLEISIASEAISSGETIIVNPRKALVFIKNPVLTEVNIGLDQCSYFVSEGSTVDVVVGRAADGLMGVVTYDISVRSLSSAAGDYSGVPTTSETVGDDSTDTITITGVADSDFHESLEVFEISIASETIPSMETIIVNPRKALVFVKNVVRWYIFDCADFTVDESTNSVIVKILRKGDTTAAGHVSLATRELSAVAADFTAVDMQVDFIADQTMEEVTISITSDMLVEHDEQFQVYLYDPDTGETLGELYKAIVTIYDEPPGFYEFQKVVYHVMESSPYVTIAVLRYGLLVNEAAGSVDISTRGHSENPSLTAEDGSDYIGFQDVVLEYEVGEKTETYEVQIADDVNVDDQIYFEVCLSNPIKGTIDGPECAVIYIENTYSMYGFDKPVYYVKEDSSVAINVVRIGCLKTSGSVGVTTYDVTARETDDYEPHDNTLLFFEIGETYDIVVIKTASPDSRLEGEERFEVCVNNPVQGALGSYGIIRCTTVVILDCDSEIAFSDVTYTVKEDADIITVDLMRRGFPGNIVTVEVVSKSVTAKFGLTRDYYFVAHTVVFGDEEIKASIDVKIFDDNVVENLEVFHLELQSISGSLIGHPKVAEISIEDDDVTCRFVMSIYSVSENDGQVRLAVTRVGTLEQETVIGVYTSDISASSAEIDKDYQPLFKESSTVRFLPDETIKMVTIDIVDDGILETLEEFQVRLTSDVLDQLGEPYIAVVMIRDDDFRGAVPFEALGGNTCSVDCQNGGFCINHNKCQCMDGYTGTYCEREKEKQILGRVYIDQFEGAIATFSDEMYNTTGNDFNEWAEILEPQLADALRAIDGYSGVSLWRLLPTDDGAIQAVFAVTVASSSTADESTVARRIEASTNSDRTFGFGPFSIKQTRIVVGNAGLDVTSIAVGLAAATLVFLSIFAGALLSYCLCQQNDATKITARPRNDDILVTNRAIPQQPSQVIPTFPSLLNMHYDDDRDAYSQN